MSNFEKPPTPLERLKADATYHDAQAADCESGIKRVKTREADLAADAESYRKLARETRAAIKTLEDAAAPAVVFDYAKPAFKYDFKVGDRVEYASTYRPRSSGVVMVGYTGDMGSARAIVDWGAYGVHSYGVSQIEHAPAKPKYDFKVGQYVKHVMGTNAGYIHSAYTGDKDNQLIEVCHTVRGVEDWCAQNIRKS